MEKYRWPNKARVTVTLLALVCAALSAILILGPTDDKDQTVDDSTVVNTMPLGMAPTNLYESTYERSYSIFTVSVGQTAYTAFGTPEPSRFHMVPLARSEDGKLCLTEGARVWDKPAMRVGEYTYVNVAVKRTGESSYEVIASPDDAAMIRRDTEGGPYKFPCMGDAEVTLRSDASARAVLGLIQDMEPGAQGWVPANTVRVAKLNAKEGFMSADVTSRVSFPGSTHVYMRPDRTLLVDGSSYGYEIVDASDIKSMREAPDLYRAVVIGPR